MADVACFCGCCFSFAGNVAACPECGAAASLMTYAFAADSAQGAESVCVPHWNGLPSTEPTEWDPMSNDDLEVRVQSPSARSVFATCLQWVRS
jgi:hypothetical protein